MERRNRQFTFAKKSVPYVLILLGILIPSSLRKMILPGRMGEINFLFLIATIMILLQALSKKADKKVVFSLLYITIMLGICFISNIKYGYSLEYVLFTLLFTSLPFYQLCAQNKMKIDHGVLLFAFKLFNIIINIIIYVGILNRLGGNGINRILFDFFSMEYDADTYYRLWSIYGHPLYNSFLIMVYYSANYLFRKNSYKKSKVKMSYVTIISLIGIVLGESKAAILVFLLLLIVLNFKSIKSLVFEILVVLVSYFAGLFDFILRRISQTSFSSRRFENYMYLSQQSYFKKYKFFYGYGTNFERVYYKDKFYAATAAYEIPILSLALNYGILYTIMFVLITIVYPSIIFVRRKQYDFLICWVALSAYINTFNAIAIIDDYLFIYIFLETLFLYISKVWANMNKENKIWKGIWY